MSIFDIILLTVVVLGGMALFLSYLDSKSSATSKKSVIDCWHQSLKKVGIEVSVKKLNRIYENHCTRKKDMIPLEVLFKRKDYQALVSHISPGKMWDSSNDGYREWGISTDTLKSAVHVSQLLAYIETINESKRLIGSETHEENISNEAKVKLKMIMEEELEAKAKIHSIIYAGYMDERNFILKFSNEAMLSEDERLQLVDEKMKNAKPKKIDVVSEGEFSITSPALIELNDFLNENQLPEEVEGELKETMRQIKEKLTLEADAKDVENVLLQASVLNTTAKDFHKIS